MVSSKTDAPPCTGHTTGHRSRSALTPLFSSLARAQAMPGLACVRAGRGPPVRSCRRLDLRRRRLGGSLRLGGLPGPPLRVELLRSLDAELGERVLRPRDLAGLVDLHL